MNIEKKYIRRLLKKSLKSDFEKILAEAKMTEAEEIICCWLPVILNASC